MKTAKEPLLRNPEIQPTRDVIASALGEANNAYLTFIDQLTNNDLQLEWRYYNDGKAWLAKGLYNWTGARGGQKQTTVFWLSVWNGFFKVTIYIPEKVRADLLRLPLGDDVKQLVNDSKQMGKLKFFPLVFDFCSEEMFEEFFTLAEFRKSVK